jgi:uncharacterized membrane protein
MVPLLVIPEAQRQRELKRAEAHAAYERQRWREKLVILVIIAFWNLVGLWVIGMSMATTDPVRGEALMVLGTSLGYGGMALSLLLYLVRLAGRGES